LICWSSRAQGVVLALFFDFDFGKPEIQTKSFDGSWSVNEGPIFSLR
jgi:hypothetical protein